MTRPTTSTTQFGGFLGVLLVGGDWACANGDFSALRHVANQMAADLPAWRNDLGALADACDHEPERAAALWVAIKDQLHRPRA